MRRNIIICFLLALCLILAGCGGDKASAPGTETTASATDAGTAAPNDAAPDAAAASLPDGIYSAEFHTDSSMFHVNEAYHDVGTLTVKDGSMTIHITMPSKNVLNLFPGTAEQAQTDGASLLEPTLDSVTYDDGMTEEVFGFDIPVPYLDDEFDCALVGTKGKWYDHKVYVCNVVKRLDDGEYTMEVTMTGGTGRASIDSPANITVSDGEYTAEIVWSSPHYEYMTVGGVQYDPVNTEGNSVFLIPVTPDTDMTVTGMTTAMSEPHEIEYVLRFDSGTLKAK